MNLIIRGIIFFFNKCELGGFLKLTRTISKKYNTTNNVLCATQETNNNVRENRDWERMKGRAVS